MFNESDLTALAITLKLAGVTTLILLLLGTPLAWWLARSRWRFKFLLEAIVALPLVLPPTVLGFYLLVTLGPRGPIGGLMESLGGRPLAFTFTGLVIGSVIYSMPFVVQPLQNAFEAIGRRDLQRAVAKNLETVPFLDQNGRVRLDDGGRPLNNESGGQSLTVPYALPNNGMQVAAEPGEVVP